MLNNWDKVDKFYLMLIGLLVLMSVLFVLSVRGVFNVFLKANELDTEALNPGVRVDKDKLDQAYDFVYDKDTISLEQTVNVVVKPTEAVRKPSVTPTPRP